MFRMVSDPGPSGEGLWPLGSSFVQTVSPLSLWGLLCSGSQGCCLNLPATTLSQAQVGVSPSAVPPPCTKQPTGRITSPDTTSASAQKPWDPGSPSPVPCWCLHVGPLPPQPPGLCASHCEHAMSPPSFNSHLTLIWPGAK